jgi:acyl-CoA oxidase
MVSDSFQVGKKFITVALRYATIRRQFGKDENGLEKKIVDYRHHRRRLFPLLATIYAFNSAAMEVTAFNEKCQQLALSGDVKNAIPNLKDLFALSAGLKAFATWEVCKIIEESRQACGGHGYSAYNDFGKGYDDWVVQCTWEGDNNVLSLSCGRALIQNYLTLEKGGTIGNYSQYLKNTDDDISLTEDLLDDVEHLIKTWEFVSKNLIVQGALKFKRSFAQTQDSELSFEKISSNRFEIAKIHTKLTFLKTFYDRVKSSPPSVRPVLTLLSQLFALHITTENIAQFYAAGIIKGSSFHDALNDKIDAVNDKLRPDIIGLTDAFNLSDFFIGAKIGNYDGNAYENYFKFVNSQSKEGGYKPHYYGTVLNPFLHRDTRPNDNDNKPK